ncbi:MAG: hypothetical protein LQ348_005849 [Seirophora lacunosa]|nr:MAG: hypothetical protein LQ348_005849 [Seirophora lacunosa]
MDVDLTAVIPQLASVPACAHPAYGAMIADPCGVDLECICSNDMFFMTMQGVLAMGNCTAPEAQAAIVNTRKLCIEAVPWLARDRGPEFVAAVTVLLILATVAVVLRFLARSVNRSLNGWDDWLMLCALVTNPSIRSTGTPTDPLKVWEYGLCIVQYFAIHYGCGKHILMLDLDQITAFGKAFFATSCIFPTACLFLKLSILYFYLRIFSVRKFTVWVKIIGAVCVAWWIAFLVAQFLICRPLECFWDKSNPDCKCINAKHVAYYITSPPDILTNLAILILPIPWLWSLQMQTRKKVAIMLILLLGSFSVIGSIIRVPFLSKMNYNDISYTIVNSGIWLNVEVGIGIVSGCLPLLRPLCSRAFPSQLRSRFSKSGTTGGSQRLPEDSSTNDRKMRSNVNASGDHGTFSGNRRNRSWYANQSGVSTAAGGGKRGKADLEGAGSSEEDMVPMGRIQVRYDVEWGGGEEEEEGKGRGKGGVGIAEVK